jgi:nitrite reductase [NAD(P)H] small subunit
MKVRVCRLEDIPPLGARRYVSESNTIAIFRAEGDAVFAVDDRCPHKGGPLSQGIVFGTSVACPLHNLTIELGSGCAAPPDEGCVKRHLVDVVDGWVELMA